MNNTTKKISIKNIKTKKDYKEALKNIEVLIDQDPKPGSDKEEQLAVLSVLVEDYESREFPLKTPDPITAIKLRMEQMNLTPKDLVPYIGSNSGVSQILSGKKALTLSMIQHLVSGLGIPAQSLIGSPSKPNVTATITR